MKRRRRGTGTIEAKRGRFMARLPTDAREILGTCDTWDEAAELLDGWLAERADGVVAVATGLSLRTFGAEWLDRRELDGYHAIGTDRSRWTTHVLAATFIDWPLKAITRAAIIDWVDDMKAKRAAPGHKQQRRHIERRKLGRSTVQNTLNLLRCCLAAALERHIIPENPADGVRLRMKSTKTEEPWTFLDLDEQRALMACEAIPHADRRILQFAIGTGLREGELWNMELRDLHIDGASPRVVVRFGSKGLPPKNGKIREVPLFGFSLDAARGWVEEGELAQFAPKNPDGLVWPTARGHRRQASKPPGGQYKGPDGKMRYRFHDWIEAAGIAREVRFHDLRHTCGSALISGMWGRRWSLEEVRDLLGHQSVKTTERYAHLAPSALQAAASATGHRKPPVSHQEGGEPAKSLAPPARYDRATFGLGSLRSIEQDRAVRSAGWRNGGLSERLAGALAGVSAGSAFALRELIDAAEAAAVALAAGGDAEEVEVSDVG